MMSPEDTVSVPRAGEDPLLPSPERGWESPSSLDAIIVPFTAAVYGLVNAGMAVIYLTDGSEG